MTIPSSRSLIFEVKSTGSELAFIRVLRLGLANVRAVSSFVTDGRPRKTSDFFGRLRTSSEIFGNDRVVFKNPSTPRIKITRLYFRKSWQVYNRAETKGQKNEENDIDLWRILLPLHQGEAELAYDRFRNNVIEKKSSNERLTIKTFMANVAI